MAVIREYRCNDCGHQFESMDSPDEAFCPQCDSEEAEREFRTAPGIKSPDTSFNDKMVKSLAKDYGLSDLNNKDGQAAKKRHQGPEAQWGGQGQIMNRLSQIGAAADQASPLLPMFKERGGPRNWEKTPMVRK